MSSSVPMVAESAKFTSSNACGVSARSCGGLDGLIEVCRRVWPRKTAQEIAFHTGISQRSAEYWLAGKYSISLEAAKGLLRSEHGYEFLKAFMGDSKAAWWWRVEHQSKTGDTRRQLKAVAKKLAALREQQEEMDL